MFLDYLRGYRKYASGLPDLLPWGTVVDGDRGTILCKDESFLSTYHMMPYDQDSWSLEAQGVLLARLNRAWTPLQSGGVWIDTWRHPAMLPPPRKSQHRLAQMIEENHRATYDPQLLTQDTYVSLWHGQSTGTQDLVKRVVLPMLDTEALHSLEAHHDECSAAIDVVKSCVDSIEPMTGDVLATYLHGLISDDQSFTKMPEFPTGLDYAFADCDLNPGWYPRLMRDEQTGTTLAILTLKSFPAMLDANQLRGLWELPFSFRLVTRWLPQNLEEMESQLTDRQKKLTAKSYGLQQAFTEWILSNPTRMRNRYLEEQTDDTDIAKLELKKEEVAFGDLSVMLVFSHPDVAVVQAQRREAERVLRMTGLVTRREWVNPVGALLSTIPGVALSNPRRWRLSTMNWLSMATFHLPSLGSPPTAETAKTPMLTLTKTAGCNPYWLSLFDGDVPHALIPGPSGSGKSTFMKFLAAQWFVAFGPEVLPQLFWFDWKRSAELFIRCMGGTYHDLGRDKMNFQPLRDIHNLVARAAAFTWMCDLVNESHEALTSHMENHLRVSLEILSTAPISKRTLTEWELVSSAQSTRAQQNIQPGSVHPETGARDHSRRDKVLDDHQALRRVIHPFTRGEIYGHLFDGDHDDITDGNIHGFEFESLMMTTPQLLVPAQAHIWSRLYPRFDGTPTLIPIDEAGEFLKYPIIQQWVDRGSRMFREKVVALMLATQHHQDFVKSEIGPMLRRFPNMFLLPDADAMADDTRPSYEALGLGRDEIQRWVASTRPKRDVYDKRGRRLLHLPMAPLAGAICAPSSPEVHQQIGTVLAQEGPQGFLGGWLRLQGLHEEAEELCHGSS